MTPSSAGGVAFRMLAALAVGGMAGCVLTYAIIGTADVVGWAVALIFGRRRKPDDSWAIRLVAALNAVREAVDRLESEAPATTQSKESQ